MISLHIQFHFNEGGIKGEGLSETICIVVRYSGKLSFHKSQDNHKNSDNNGRFLGGIKLGAGGLIRAYGGTARLVLRHAEQCIILPKSTISVTTLSSNAGFLYSAASKFGGIVSGETYDAEGLLEVTIICETKHIDALKDDIVGCTRGDVTFKG